LIAGKSGCKFGTYRVRCFQRCNHFTCPVLTFMGILKDAVLGLI
jgi:hypothetical protein